MYKTIEELVDKIDERNTDGSVSELIGVSIDKCFIKSVANTNSGFIYCLACGQSRNAPVYCNQLFQGKEKNRYCGIAP